MTEETRDKILLIIENALLDTRDWPCSMQADEIFERLIEYLE